MFFRRADIRLEVSADICLEVSVDICLEVSAPFFYKHIIIKYLRFRKSKILIISKLWQCFFTLAPMQVYI